VAEAARAQPQPAAPPASDPNEPAGYRPAIDAAIGEYEGGHFAEARALFERANQIYPNARSLRGMGMAEFELRNYGASLQFLQQALASPAKPLQGELRTETEQLLARARGFVGRVTIDLSPPDAEVLLNGSRILLPTDRVLTLNVGDYTLKFNAREHTSEERQLRIAGGEEQSLRVELPLIVNVLPPQAATAAPEPEKSSSVLASPWLWTAVGVVIAGAAVGVGFALSGGGTRNAPANGGTTEIVLKGP
jgi:hypothetical protein